MDFYEITAESLKKLIDWKKVIRQSKCQNKNYALSTSDQLLNQGHENCDQGCPGNYWYGGICNLSGFQHTLKEDLVKINDNFLIIDDLTKIHHLLKTSSEENFAANKRWLLQICANVLKNCQNPKFFFYGTCLTIEQSLIFQKGVVKRFQSLASGIEKYRQKISNLSWEHLQKFPTKLQTIVKLEKELTEREEKFDNLPVKKSFQAFGQELELMTLEEYIKRKIRQLNNHPAWIIFDRGINEFLPEIKKELFEPSTSQFFTTLERKRGSDEWVMNQQSVDLSSRWSEEKEEDQKKESNEQSLNNYSSSWWDQNQSTIKKVAEVSAVSLILIVLIYLIKRSFAK